MKIIIEINDTTNPADHCRYVADQFEAGFYGGVVGCTCDNWEIE